MLNNTETHAVLYFFVIVKHYVYLFWKSCNIRRLPTKRLGQCISVLCFNFYRKLNKLIKEKKWRRFFISFRSAFHQSSVVSRAGRVLVVMWMLLGVVLASVYSSKLTSSLTVNEQALPFTSMAELISQNTYRWGLASGTAQEAILRVG